MDKMNIFESNNYEIDRYYNDSLSKCKDKEITGIPKLIKFANGFKTEDFIEIDGMYYSKLMAMPPSRAKELVEHYKNRTIEECIRNGYELAEVLEFLGMVCGIPDFGGINVVPNNLKTISAELRETLEILCTAEGDYKIYNDKSMTRGIEIFTEYRKGIDKAFELGIAEYICPELTYFVRDYENAKGVEPVIQELSFTETKEVDMDNWEFTDKLKIEEFEEFVINLAKKINN